MERLESPDAGCILFRRFYHQHEFGFFLRQFFNQFLRSLFSFSSPVRGGVTRLSLLRTPQISPAIRPITPVPGNRSTTSSKDPAPSKSRIQRQTLSGFAPQSPFLSVIGATWKSFGVICLPPFSGTGWFLFLPPRKITGSQA